jgi:hypothetical protein
MLTAVATFVSSLTGKIALGTAVAAASVGTAHATHVVDLPGVPRSETEVVVTAELDEEPVPTTSTTSTTTTTTTSTTLPDEDETDDGIDDGTEQNHGQIVSTFAHETELEGCERGQAIAELASEGRANRQAPIENCAKDDAAEDEVEDEVEDDDAADAALEAESDETGKPANAGKSGKARKNR